MYLYVFLIITTVFISLTVFAAGNLLNKKSENNKLNRSPFECGITTTIFSIKPVRTRFFLLRVVFLIFDIELILIYPILLE
jgi:NADH-ubiquinone oxidoreductase chain 3